jgi:pheromone shutdown-related protein TraB
MTNDPQNPDANPPPGGDFIVPQEDQEEPPEWERDVVRVQRNGREFVLVGTAHISQESVDTVREVIRHEEPDQVCVELDEERYRALRREQKFEDLDLLQVIKEGKLTFLLARLALTAFQKRMGDSTGVTPGAEMAAAADTAEEMGVPVVLADRNIRTTLLRAWRLTPWYRRAELAAMLFLSLFQTEEVSEQDLSDLKQGDMISEILDELAEVMPELKEVLVDERDLYMAKSIQDSPGEKVVAIVGAAHREGIARWLEHDIDPDIVKPVDEVPEKSTLSELIPWILPAIVIGLFVYGFFYGDTQQLQTAATAWVLANGILSAVGAIAALAHPVTVIVAFVAAPLTSLNPTIGAGMVTAFTQTVVAAPKVRDLHTIGEDLTEWTGWWSNRVGRVLLVFLFSSVGSAIGTFLAFGWLKNLL